MASMRLLYLALSLAVTLALPCFCTPANSYGRKVGGRTEVKDVESNEEVQELGRFSVREYNRMRGTSNGQLLMFCQVIAAERQLVAGIKYYLKIEARQHGVTKVFVSVVVVKPWLQSRELLSFISISSSSSSFGGRDLMFGF